MRIRNERGEGKIAGIFFLAVLAGFVYFVVHVGPLYVAHKNLQDEVTQIARMSIGFNDNLVREKIQDAIDENELYDYISAKDFKINKRANRRAIKGEFSATLEVLPSYEKTFLFEIDVDEPTF